jgi:hypothetical protein
MTIAALHAPLPAEPSEFTKQAIELLDVLYQPRFHDLRSRCAEAAAKAAHLGERAVREAVNAVALEVAK